MKTYRRMLSYLAKYSAAVAATWFCSVLIVLSQVVTVWVGATVVEMFLMERGAVPAGATAAFPAILMLDRYAMSLLRQGSLFRSLLAAVAVLLASQLALAALRMAKLILFARVNQTILTDVRCQMFAHLTECDLGFYRKRRHGETASLFLRDVDQLSSAFIDAADRMFLQPLRLIVGIGLMAMISWPLTLWVLAVLVGAGAFIHKAGNHIERRFRAVSEKRARIEGHLVEYLSTVLVARSLGREGYERERFRALCEDLKGSVTGAVTTSGATPLLITAVFSTAGSLLLLWCGYQALALHRMSGGVVIKMSFLLPLVTYPLESLATLSNSVRESMASARRVFAFLDRPAPMRAFPDALTPEPFQNEIVFRGVGYELDGNRILSGICLVIPRRGVVVIHGPSGAGKSTILSLVAAFIHCSEGAITVDGCDIRRLRAADWRMQVGIVPQDCVLLNGTVRDNLLYAKPEASDAELFFALRGAGIGADSAALRDGLDTPVGNRGEFMSGGERQRITIARALLRAPRVLLLDEPTSMLDEENQTLIAGVIKRLSEEHAVIIASHDASLKSMADLAVALKDGKIAGTESQESMRGFARQ